MPRSSKWCGAKLLQRNYEGLSGSDQLHRWDVQRCAPGITTQPCRASPSYSMWTPDIDTTKPWYELRGDDYYCLLCSAYATDGHVESDRHKKREANPEWYGFAVGTTQLSEEEVYDRPWFEKKGGDWYCRLCNAFATEGHLESQRHKTRSSLPQAYGFPQYMIADSAASTGCSDDVLHTGSQQKESEWETFKCPQSGQPYYHNTRTGVTQWDPPDSDPDFPPIAGALEEGPRYYCEAPLDQPRRRVVPEQDMRSRMRQDLERLPEGWVRHWSPEHKDFYFHHEESDVVQWELPEPDESDECDEFEV